MHSVATNAVRSPSTRRPRPPIAARGREVVPAVAGLVTTALIMAMCWESGGYFASSYLRAGGVAFAALGVVLLVARPAFGLSRTAIVAVGSLVGLTVWTGLSALWSPAPDAAIAAMQRDLAYLGLFALAIVTVGSGRYARHIMWGVLLVMATVVIAALLSRLYPGLVPSPGPDETLNYRLAYPLSYWNALGALAAMTAVLSFGLAADPRSAWPLRALCAGLAVVAVTTMYLTLSRGAWLALALGVVALVLLSAHRGSLILTAVTVGIGSALAVARAASYTALVDDPTAGAGQASDGRAFGLQLWLLIAAVCVVHGLVAAGRASPRLMEAVDRSARRLAVAGGVIVIAALGVGYAVRAADAEGASAKALNRSQDWVSRQWRDFMRPASPPPAPIADARRSARLTNANGSRSGLYRIALDGFADAPIRGQGAGSYVVGYLRERKSTEYAQNAHSLELETLYEGGLVGAVLLLAFLAAATTAAVRRRLNPGGLGRSQVAAVSAAMAVWIAHSAVDWDWQMSGLTAVALVLMATLLPFGRSRRRRSGTGAT